MIFDVIVRSGTAVTDESERRSSGVGALFFVPGLALFGFLDLGHSLANVGSEEHVEGRLQLAL